MLNVSGLGHQKAPGKGGHHLGLFGPITHRRSTPGCPRSATHLTQSRGPPVTGIAMPSKVTLKVEVILTVCDQKREIANPRGFKSTQFCITG